MSPDFLLHFTEIVTCQTFGFLVIRAFLNHYIFTYKWQAYVHTQLKLTRSQKKGENVHVRSLHLQFLHAFPETLPVPYKELGGCSSVAVHLPSVRKTLGLYSSQEGQWGDQPMLY